MSRRVKPGAKIRFNRIDPESTPGCKGGKARGEKELRRLSARLEALQELLYAEGKRKVLIILQGMDTSGKDGVIRHALSSMNPQGVTVTNFKAPTPQELAHDFLWRVHPHVPGSGQVVIFNRSHLEDILFPWVHGQLTDEGRKQRVQAINAFESMLADSGVTILKFYLHISKEQQKRRLQRRLDDPRKRWKFNPNDLVERKRWAKYMRAYEYALARTSTNVAPWYIIPADRKWYRDLAIARIIVETLENLKMKFPKPNFEPKAIVIE